MRRLLDDSASHSVLSSAYVRGILSQLSCVLTATKSRLPYDPVIVSGFHSQFSSRAFSDTFVFNRRPIEQPILAPTAASMKSENLSAGTFATTSSKMPVIVQSSMLRSSELTVAVVTMRSAGNPARLSASDKAIEKDAA